MLWTKFSRGHSSRQLDEYLDRNYIGERLRPYGGRQPDPYATGFFSEAYAKHQMWPKLRTEGPFQGAEQFTEAEAITSKVPQPAPSSFVRSDDEKDKADATNKWKEANADHVQASAEPVIAAPSIEEPGSFDEDDPFAEIFKIFSRDGDTGASHEESEEERRQRERQRERAELQRKEREAQKEREESERKEREEKDSSPEKAMGRAVGEYVKSREEETFSEYLNRVILERGFKDADVYNSVYMGRKLFNKIRNDPTYQPSKRTALLLAIALHLTLEETQDFIGRAGYIISHSSKTDLIVEFFIVKENYDVLEINEMLYEFHMPLLLKSE